MDSNQSFFNQKYSLPFFCQSKRKKIFKLILEEQKRHLKNDLFSNESLRILDVGFFQLEELELILKFYPNSTIVGVDSLDNKYLKRMSQKSKDVSQISVIQGDINNLDFEKNYFDLIFCLNTLYFAQDTGLVLKIFSDILLKKGILIIELDQTTQRRNDSIIKKYEKNNVRFNTLDEEWLKKQINKVGFKKVITLKHSVNNNLILVAFKNK